MVGQRLHELRRRRGAQVFGNLEADHQIEGSSEIEFSLQIERGDQVLRDPRQLPVQPVSFYAQDVGDPEVPGRREPRADPASDI